MATRLSGQVVEVGDARLPEEVDSPRCRAGKTILVFLAMRFSTGSVCTRATKASTSDCTMPSCTPGLLVDREDVLDRALGGMHRQVDRPSA